MSDNDRFSQVFNILSDVGVSVDKVEEREFPGERWLIIFVSEELLTVAQSVAGSIERTLNANDPDADPFAVTFRPTKDPEAVGSENGDRRSLSRSSVTRLVQLLEARSRASDALPSLRYVEDPRASLSAVAASRHQLIYGRRGVGKTALLLEAKRRAEKDGHIAVWMNVHVLRNLSAASAFAIIAQEVISALIDRAGTSQSPAFSRLRKVYDETLEAFSDSDVTDNVVGKKVPRLNQALRGVLRAELLRLNVYLDDFYLMPMENQALLLDYLAGMLRDCDGWLKIASIERLTQPFEPASRIGLEVPHDASKMDLDVTLEDPRLAQEFLESVLSDYVTSAGVKQISSVAKPDARGRLVLASGGVPRDYINLFASSIVVARQSRQQAREIGKEDVAKAAGLSARTKKIDLERDVSSERSRTLTKVQEALSAYVKSAGCTFFRVSIAERESRGYEILGQLVDMRFAHLVQSILSDQHKAGIKYEAYILDLSEYTDVRLKRRLAVLDLENGHWVRRQSGQAGTKQSLTGTQFRDVLRHGPLVKLDELLDLSLRDE